ncbi:hypothetical protein CCACVL1_22976 [Corchorus capsularis]|uniref:Uncharacterized protein n=1 Tax=Corchorus capsularis TaxID=210143 RepID=A0A1R3GVV9_COCAP|nr:hypothetical protein CCACVL1_22976 [Corchorus capsularis]
MAKLNVEESTLPNLGIRNSLQPNYEWAHFCVELQIRLTAQFRFIP